MLPISDKPLSMPIMTKWIDAYIRPLRTHICFIALKWDNVLSNWPCQHDLILELKWKGTISEEYGGYFTVTKIPYMYSLESFAKSCLELWLIALQATSGHWPELHWVTQKRYLTTHIGNYNSTHWYKVYWMISQCQWYAWNTKVPKSTLIQAMAWWNKT